MHFLSHSGACIPFGPQLKSRLASPSGTHGSGWPLSALRSPALRPSPASRGDPRLWGLGNPEAGEPQSGYFTSFP